MEICRTLNIDLRNCTNYGGNSVLEYMEMPSAELRIVQLIDSYHKQYLAASSESSKQSVGENEIEKLSLGGSDAEIVGGEKEKPGLSGEKSDLAGGWGDIHFW